MTACGSWFQRHTLYDLHGLFMVCIIQEQKSLCSAQIPQASDIIHGMVRALIVSLPWSG